MICKYIQLHNSMRCYSATSKKVEDNSIIFIKFQ